MGAFGGGGDTGGGGGPGGGIGIPLPPISIGSGGASASASSTQAAFGALTSWLQSTLHTLASFLWSVLHAIWNFLKNAFLAVLALVRHLSETWLGKIVVAIWRHAVAIYKQFSAYAKQVIKTIEYYEKLVNQYEQRIFGPILNLISRLRRSLLLFRLLHLKWANKLDQYLADREAAIANLLLHSRRILNTYIDYLNLIIDPTGLINQGLYIKSAIQSITQLWGALYQVQAVAPGAGTLAAQQQTAHRYDAKNMPVLAASTATAGLSPADQQYSADARAAYARLGYTV